VTHATELNGPGQPRPGGIIWQGDTQAAEDSHLIPRKDYKIATVKKDRVRRILFFGRPIVEINSNPRLFVALRSKISKILELKIRQNTKLVGWINIEDHFIAELEFGREKVRSSSARIVINNSAEGDAG